MIVSFIYYTLPTAVKCLKSIYSSDINQQDHSVKATRYFYYSY